MSETDVKDIVVDALPDPPGTVGQADDPAEIAGHEFAPAQAKVTLRSLRAETEMQAISQALLQTGWNRKRAAQLLSISYRGLLYKIRQHNITKNQDVRGVPKRPQMADTLSNWESPDLAVAGGGTPGKD
jgi:DNA-binding NtrC family response regulator